MPTTPPHGAERLHVDLELELDSDPIAGTLADRCSAARPFVGWLGLMHALDELRTRTVDRSAGKAS